MAPTTSKGSLFISMMSALPERYDSLLAATFHTADSMPVLPDSGCQGANVERHGNTRRSEHMTAETHRMKPFQHRRGDRRPGGLNPRRQSIGVDGVQQLVHHSNSLKGWTVDRRTDVFNLPFFEPNCIGAFMAVRVRSRPVDFHLIETGRQHRDLTQTVENCAHGAGHNGYFDQPATLPEHTGTDKVTANVTQTQERP